MPYSLTYRTEDQILVVKVSGYYSDIGDFLDKMETENKKFLTTGTRRVLFDDRDLEITLDILDCIVFAERVLDEGLQTKGFRYACIPSDTGWDYYRAFETVLQNRSINYRLFKNERDAIDWLTA